MEHAEYLKKVTAAKKHQTEYRNAGTNLYCLALIFGVFGGFILASVMPEGSYLPFITVVAGFLIGGIGFFKIDRNLKEFCEKFPEENQIIAEYEELLK